VRFYSAVNIIAQLICSLFQTVFGERGIVLCLFHLKLLDTRFAYLYWTVFSAVHSVFLLFCDIVLICVTVFILYIVFFIVLILYCTVSACNIRAVTLTEGFPCFFFSFKANARV
jgi:hypothetical protein